MKYKVLIGLFLLMMVFGVRGVSAVEQLTRCSSLYEGMTWCAWNDESSWTLFQDKLESMRRKKYRAKEVLYIMKIVSMVSYVETDNVF